MLRGAASKGDIQESARTKGKRRNIAHSVGSGRLFTISDEDLVDHVKHANSKLPWHWCEPRRGLQGAVRIGQTLLPSRFHRRAAELEVLERTLRLDRPVDELNDVHLSHATVLVEPLRLCGVRELRRQQFVQLIDCISNVMLFAQHIRGKHGPTSITNVLLALVDLIKISRPMAMRWEHVDLKD